MAHWTYFLLAIVWAFSLEVECRCDTTYTLRGQSINLFANGNIEQPCVKVGECVIGWKEVKKNGQDVVEYEVVAPTSGFIAIGLNSHGNNWRGADIPIVTGTASNYHYRDCMNKAEDIFRPTIDTDGQDMTLDRIEDNVELRTVAFSRPRYLASSLDRTIKRGTYLLCAYGPQTNLDNLDTLTIADASQETASYYWNGTSALSASVTLLLLVTAMAAYLNIK